ncbi:MULTISPECIES: hypothetical protein [Arthrobacter]|uniref:Uncharacterized protein n=1 Tax=Arthrobacter terricola TaxID=2547396 RepID=A0A4R5KQ48_9MICC|nr:MULTISPECIES: hypothetical protein [Arthrobacter]MBT8160993.1 hypothetical protein [Arthrobacter sp. GN70]TDF96857.1 hypothetical protein E1809_09035 [Arthrobacter terricola]
MTNIVGPGAPYITPAMLIAAPTGISWSTIPTPRASPEQQLAEQLNICMRATAAVDDYVSTPLRATIDTETLFGPGDMRFQIRPNGTCWLVLSRPPVVSVLSGQYSASASFPPAWTPLDASKFKVYKPIMGLYGTSVPGTTDTGGQAVLMAPGVVSGSRGSVEVQVTYMNGWPHTQLMAAANVGDTTIQIDDVTGWLGACGTIRDSVGQEAAVVTAVSPTVTGSLSGPGTLTLAAPLANAHPVGTLFTTIPESVVSAAILYAVSEALVRGATAVSAPGGSGSSGGGSKSIDQYTSEAELKIHRFRPTL